RASLDAQGLAERVSHGREAKKRWPKPPLFVSPARSALPPGLCSPVDEGNRARARLPRLDEFKVGSSPLFKQPLPAAEHDGVDEQAILVNDACWYERVDQLAAAEDQNVLAVLLFQPADLLSDVVADDLGGAPLALFCRRRDEVLLHAVDAVSIAVLVLPPRPGLGKALVRHPAQQQRVHVEQLLLLEVGDPVTP